MTFREELKQKISKWHDDFRKFWWDRERPLIFLVFVLGLLTIALTWVSYNIDNHIDSLRFHISEETSEIVRFTSEDSRLKVLEPFLKSGLLKPVNPGSDLQFVYGEIYLKLIEAEFETDAAREQEVKSVETIEDYFEKRDLELVREIADNVDDLIERADFLSKLSNLFFFIIILIQVISVIAAYRLAVITIRRE